VPFTKGFASWADLSDHFTKHVLQRRELSVATEAEYEALADAFLGGPMDQHTEECVRPRDHDKIRFNKITNEFGVLRSDGYIRTYFRASTKRHSHPTNLDYFIWECNQT